jgi:DNA-binding NtrC family response regulator
VMSLVPEQETQQRAMTHYATAQPAGKSAASLLVVGADLEDRGTLSDALQADAYEIVFCDSLDATDPGQFDGRPFDACIIGLNRPVETCFDLLAAIKRNRPLAEVIILSRLADEELWIESIQRGAYDFLPKPLDRKELRRIVKNAIERNRCRHQ